MATLHDWRNRTQPCKHRPHPQNNLAAEAHPGQLVEATTAGGPPPKPSPVLDYAQDPDRLLKPAPPADLLVPIAGHAAFSLRWS